MGFFFSCSFVSSKLKFMILMDVSIWLTEFNLDWCFHRCFIFCWEVFCCLNSNIGPRSLEHHLHMRVRDFLNFCCLVMIRSGYRFRIDGFGNLLKKYRPTDVCLAMGHLFFFPLFCANLVWLLFWLCHLMHSASSYGFCWNYIWLTIQCEYGLFFIFLFCVVEVYCV